MKKKLKMKDKKLRDILIFLAGAEFFHTISHILLSYMVVFPWNTKYIIVTQSLNNWGVLLNGILTIVLLVWASKLNTKAKK